MSALTLFFILFATSYVNGFLLVRFLQNSHRGLWTDLGEPSLTQSNLGTPRKQLTKLIWSLRFLKIQDGKLNLFCFVAMLLDIGIVITVVCLLWFA